MALTDPALPLTRKLAVIEDIFGARALQTSVALITLVVAAGRTSDLSAVTDRFVELAASERSEAVAEVRSAIPLDEDQKARLAAALAQRTGKNIEVKVIVDESVLGGIATRIDDTVIDGSIRHRLDQLKETI
jgi:F-type H+-transporting ATPase subunit delta